MLIFFEKKSAHGVRQNACPNYCLSRWPTVAGLFRQNNRTRTRVRPLRRNHHPTPAHALRPPPFRVCDLLLSASATLSTQSSSLRRTHDTSPASPRNAPTYISRKTITHRSVRRNREKSLIFQFPSTSPLPVSLPRSPTSLLSTLSPHTPPHQHRRYARPTTAFITTKSPSHPTRPVRV